MNTIRTIFSILYNKNRGEYLIRRKDAAGEYYNTLANHLTDEEKAFCRNCGGRNENPDTIKWHRKKQIYLEEQL